MDDRILTETVYLACSLVCVDTVESPIGAVLGFELIMVRNYEPVKIVLCGPAIKQQGEGENFYTLKKLGIRAFGNIFAPVAVPATLWLNEARILGVVSVYSSLKLHLGLMVSGEITELTHIASPPEMSMGWHDGADLALECLVNPFLVPSIPVVLQVGRADLPLLPGDLVL